MAKPGIIAIMSPTFALLVVLCLTQAADEWTGLDLAFNLDWTRDFGYHDIYDKPTTPCNKRCSCIDNNISCKSKGFTTVPELSGTLHYQFWLVDVDVSYNRITRILGSDLQTWRRMYFKTIKFNNNRLVNIEASAFMVFHRSEHLSVANNLLTTFPWHALQKTSSLVSLDLKNNMLSTAPSNALQGLHLLREFNIRNNRFTMLPNSFFRNNKHLQKVYFGGNLWQCDCNNNWLRRYMEEKGAVVQDEESIICNKPTNLERIQAKVVPKSNFKCHPPTIHNVTHYPRELSLTEGQAVFMKCNASGQEPLAVQWQDPRKKSVTTRRFSDRVQATGANDALLLMVKHLTMEDMPGYTCKASNKGGSTSVLVPLNITCTSSCPRSVPSPKPTLLVMAVKNVTSNHAELTWMPRKSADRYHLAIGKAGQKNQTTAVVDASDAGYTLSDLEADTIYSVCIGMAAPVSPQNCLSFKTRSDNQGKREVEKPTSSATVNLTEAILGGLAAISFPVIIFSLCCVYMKRHKEKAAAAAAANLQKAVWHTNSPVPSCQAKITRSDLHIHSKPPPTTDNIHGKDRDNKHRSPFDNKFKHVQAAQGMEQRHHNFKPNIPPNNHGAWNRNPDNLSRASPPQNREIYEEACPVIRGNVPPPPLPRIVCTSTAQEDIYGMA